MKVATALILHVLANSPTQGQRELLWGRATVYSAARTIANGRHKPPLMIFITAHMTKWLFLEQGVQCRFNLLVDLILGLRRIDEDQLLTRIPVDGIVHILVITSKTDLID